MVNVSLAVMIRFVAGNAPISDNSYHVVHILGNGPPIILGNVSKGLELAVNPTVVDRIITLNDSRVSDQQPTPLQVCGVRFGFLTRREAQRVAIPLPGAVGDHFGFPTHE